MKTYKIIEKNQFAYGPVTSRNGDKISIALLQDYDEAIISQAYTVFEVIDKNELNPEYLMMWFRRPEFDRYARFKSHGSARETFDWNEICEVKLPIPSIEKQHEIVKEYNTVTNRIKLNEQLNQKLEETAQALYKHWFVDFEFPCLPSDYRPHGQVNVNITNEELKNKIAQVCTYKRTGGLPFSDGRTWYVYLILCDDESIYKGMCNDLHRRFYEHYIGIGAKHTLQHKPIKVIHWEAYDTKEKAAKREKELKTGYGRTWISRQIEKAGGLSQIKTGLPAPKTELRTAGKMVYNEELDKEIPEGWEVKKISDFTLKMKSGSTPNRSNSEFWSSNDHPWLKTGELKNSVLINSEEYISELALKKCPVTLLPINTVLVAMYGQGDTKGQVGYLKIPATTNQACCAMICNDEFQATFLYYHLRVNRDEIVSVAIGGAQPNLSKEIIENIKLVIPEDTVMSKHPFVKIMKHRENLILENNALTEFRIMLLSKMSMKEEAIENY